MKIHEKYILRCIQIAKNGKGKTAPNPAVGAVLVHQDRIISEGYTSPYGGPHAEVNAINGVKDKALLKESRLYVSLEPCCHHGKTPPCTDLILDYGIPEVYIGTTDPHEKVAGNGIKRLRDAGCKVNVGIAEEACREHHRRFICFHEKKRPYIILKWATSADGFLAPLPNARTITAPHWITNRYSRQLVHKWRSEEQAILVGSTTVVADNPELTTRNWSGHHPLRIVVDPKGKTSLDSLIYNDKARTVIFTDNNTSVQFPEYIENLKIDFWHHPLPQILEALHTHNILSLIVEGGAYTINQFLEHDLWDEARVFTGNTKLKSGIKAPVLGGETSEIFQILSDLLNIYRND